MAASSDFFTGDDLDDLFSLIDGGFLDGDVPFNQEIDGIVAEVASNEESTASFQCDQCEKVCKSQRGLTRHTNVKHGAHPSTTSADISPVTLTPLEIPMKRLHPIKLMCIVKHCAENLSNDLCFPLSVRSKFNTSQFSFSNEEAVNLWYQLRTVIDCYNGDAEKFYTKFYSLFLENVLPTKFDNKSLTNTLLAEVANEILEHLSGNSTTITTEPKNKISIPDKEMKSLQYLAGFVIHKIYTKFRFSKNSASLFHQQCCLILHACKVDTDDSQTLIDARDRGGLWKVSKTMQDIFVECELIFRAKTTGFKTSIVCEELVIETMKNIIVMSNFNSIALSVDTRIKKEFRLNLLEHILTLFVRVRSA